MRKNTERLQAVETAPKRTREQLEKFRNYNGGRVKNTVLSAITATFLMASMASCSSATEKKNRNEGELVPLIENFHKTRADAIDTENLYNQAKARGDKKDMETHKYQKEILQKATIEKMERIQKLQKKNTKHTIDERKSEEKAGRKGNLITWEDALNFTP